VKLSIIIPNYNYAAYLGAAIDSALALDWPDKEVIVANDGSTDGSHAVILAYGPHIVPLLLPNGGQNAACNAAFARSSGDIAIFIDSDDVLFPSVADTLRALWSDRVSKLQWSLVVTDQSLVPLGRCFPTYPAEPTPAWVRQSLARTGHYPYSLGGAWAKSFLRQVFPLPVRGGPVSGGSNGDYRVPVIDRYLSMLAPFFGDVVCLGHDRPQGAYRMHGNNSHIGAVQSENYAYFAMEPFECARQVNTVLSRLNIAVRLVPEHDENAMRRQLVCQRFELDPRVDFRLFESLLQYWHAVRLSDAPMRRKAKWIIWSLVVAIGPQRVSAWAVRQRREGP
jgi:hypothetical protein